MARSLKKLELPLEGKFFQCDKPKYKETVVFVHFYGGNYKSCAKHAKMVNKLGYNAVTFSLSFNNWPEMLKELSGSKFPWDSQLKLGFMNVWVDEIELVLNRIPGKKILYGFSNPSGAMFIAAAKRNFTDISAIVCDSGPFLNNWKMIIPTLISQTKHFTFSMRAAIVLLNKVIFGKDYNQRAEDALNKIGSQLPILSIRSWKDELVPSFTIEEYFSKNSDLNLEVFSLTDVLHLQGLKKAKSEYVPRVKRFLKENSEPL